MKPSHVVAVSVALPCGGEKIASGYLIQPDLVLTSSHANGRLEASAEVSFLYREEGKELLQGGAQRAKKPLRIRVVDEWNDALLGLGLLRLARRIRVEHAFVAFRAPEEYLTEECVSGSLRWRAEGVPRLGKDFRANHLTPNGFGGSVERYRDRRFEVLSDEELESWDGMSGAGVFVGDELLGVVDTVPNWTGRRLQVAPVEDALSDPDFRRFLGLERITRSESALCAGLMRSMAPQGVESLCSHFGVPKGDLCVRLGSMGMASIAAEFRAQWLRGALSASETLAALAWALPLSRDALAPATAVEVASRSAAVIVERSCDPFIEQVVVGRRHGSPARLADESVGHVIQVLSPRTGTYRVHADDQDILRQSVWALVKCVPLPDAPPDVPTQMSALRDVLRVRKKEGLFDAPWIIYSGFPESRRGHVRSAAESLSKHLDLVVFIVAPDGGRSTILVADVLRGILANLPGERWL